jgi:hypothetical protein
MKRDTMSKKTNQTLNKCDELINRLQELKKALTATNVSSSRKPVNGLGAGWSQDQGTGAFHHSMHGVISTTKAPEGHYQITHGGRSVGRAASPQEAGTKIKNYVGTLHPNDTGMHNVNPMAVGKSEQDEKKKKKYSPAQLAAMEEARRLKKNSEGTPWVQHASVPNADEELARMQKANPVERAENIMSNQLANMMQGRAMLGQPPRQPTDQELFGHLVPSEDQLQKAEHQWNNRMNWLEEAVKPIGSRFASEEEELAYWSNLGVNQKNTGSDEGF